MIELINEWLDDESQGRRDLQLLADRVGVSRALLARILAGDRRVTPETAIKLAPVLGKSKLELLLIIGLVSAEDIRKYSGEVATDPALADLLRLIRENPERAKKIAPFLKKLLNESDDLPEDLSRLCEILLAMDPVKRQGLLTALGTE